MITKLKINISLESETLEKIKVLAKEDNRSVSNYIGTVLRDHIAKNADRSEA